MHESYCFYPNEPCCCGKSGMSKKEKDYKEADSHTKEEIEKKETQEEST